MMFDRKLIDDYATGGTLLRESVAGLSPADLLAYPVPGTWSIQEIVIHLMDSDLIGIDRMKRIAAEDNPLLLGYNETKFVQTLRPDLQDAEEAIIIFDLSRKLFSGVLRALSDDAFERSGIHNEVGRVTLGTQVKKYHEHLLHHLNFVKTKRQRLGR
ncbi:MAG: DinB family protein [Burkholderiales bacterium]|nr:DinB family protein [Phycisphaerae bacterium]